jgi:hypothetical protein
MRVEELQTAIGEVERMTLRAFGDVDPISLGALAIANDDGDERIYFVAPYGGGSKLEQGAVLVVTPRSPLGRALLGKRTGDASEIEAGGKTREIEIVRVD